MTEEQFESVCKELESTWEGLSTICPKYDTARSSFYDYTDKNPHALDRYARAREKQLDYLEELLFKISMDSTNDLATDDKVNLGSNVVARARLQVDTIKFVLAKLRANVWGAKIEHTIKSEPRVFKID
jgi:transcription elongation GreA/GreB family factor